MQERVDLNESDIEAPAEDEKNLQVHAACSELKFPQSSTCWSALAKSSYC